jgi:signal transduction histidine kinase
VAATFARGETAHFESEASTTDGELIEFAGVACALRGRNREVSAALLVTTDLTRTHELERSLAQVERLAHAGLSVAGLAHTIKNLLAGLDGALYLVDSGIEQPNPERLGEGWKMVKGYLAQLSGLARNLLAFAQPQPPAREQVLPAALVDEVLALYRAKAANAEITVSVEHAPGVTPVWLDRQTIHSSLANLLGNAIDACAWDPDTDKEHRIRVATSPAPGGGVIVTVADNGMGISPANQQRLLRSAFTTKGLRGTGLGLLLARKAVEDHGGTMAFTSTLGQGTEFSLRLPRGREGAAPGSSSVSEDDGPADRAGRAER